MSMIATHPIPCTWNRFAPPWNESDDHDLDMMIYRIEENLQVAVARPSLYGVVVRQEKLNLSGQVLP